MFLLSCGPKVEVSGNEQKTGISDLQDSFAYKNDKYSFGIKAFPKDFAITYMPDNTGLAMKKFVKMDPKKNFKNPDFDYSVQIYILPSDNIQEYKDLNDLIGKKFHGYTYRFVDYGTISGFFVDDGVYIDANPHFFAMNKSNSVIYQVDMKLPSRYYPAQQESFEYLVKNLQIF